MSIYSINNATNGKTKFNPIYPISNNHNTFKANNIKYYEFLTSKFIDDIRLLPKWQYLKTTKDTAICKGVSTTLRVLSGAGPYAWRNVRYPNVLLSNTNSLNVSPTDTVQIYEVMSAYDTASIVVRTDASYFATDTQYYQNCTQSSITLTPPLGATWEDSTANIGSRTFSQSGVYTYTFRENCTQTKVVNIVKIGKSTSDTTKIDLCDSAYIFRGIRYDSSGNYSQTLLKSDGCDSSITLLLNLRKINPTIVRSGFDYTVSTSNAEYYQWYVCQPTWRRISNAQSQTLTTTTKASFAVEVRYKKCIDTSDSIAWNSSAISNSEDENLIIYPNPFDQSIIIEITEP